MYTAVIIEPRKHKALNLVLSNFNNNLNKDWKFLIYHGNSNAEFIRQITKNNKMDNRCNMISLNTDNLSINCYNKLLLSEYFYENIDTEIFLIFQTDTLISNKYKDNIYKFLNYDYVGAPWKTINKVGNGGLSLRKKSKMLEMLKKGGYIKNNGEIHYEDRFFTNTFGNDIGIYLNIPTVEQAKQFSVETIFSDNSFGLHKPWNYLTTVELNLLKFNFPELEELILLNKF
jgi:hypothetical protein